MTPEFPYLRGTFAFAESSVPYFQLSLPAIQALDFLKVARELIFDPQEIVLDELFQRDIDEVRVEKEIAPYLQRAGEIKFFNAIVVVLLPHEKGQLKQVYGESTSAKDGEVIGGIQIKATSEMAGAISWDPQQICPIIVDGQHRFCALQKVAEDASNELKSNLQKTSIPIVLLALHEQLGFQVNGSSLLSTVRKIFIDLNRQAKTVSETRNILLDDRDVAAVAVRALLEKQVKSADHSLESRLNSGHLPLALVDWYSDRLKFDHGVHLTSILALYKIVTDFLKLPNFDSYDYEKAEVWGRRFIDLDPVLDFQETIAECRNNKQPVYLGSDNIRRFEEWFSRSWGPAIVHVLTSLAPYRALLDNLRSHGFVDGSLEIWAALDRAGKSVFEKSHGDASEIQSLEGAITKFKHDDLAFQVVMQRGILRAFVEMCQVQLTDNREHRNFRDMPCEYAEEWVKLFNMRIGTLSGRHEFWKGSAIRSDGSISATRTAEKAIAATIMFALLAPLSEWDDCDRRVQLQQATDYVLISCETRQKRGLSLWEQLQSTYGRTWRKTVQKFLEDTKHIYGQGQVKAISNFMAERMAACLNVDHLPQDAEPVEEVAGDYDESIDDLDRWI
jgi:DGQHR domain-containing protein